MKKLLYSLCVIVLLVGCNPGTFDINVLTFNLRYDNPDDEFNSWQFRKEVSAQLIRQQDADIIGTQEVLYSQMESLKQQLPEYTFVGVGREDGKEKGEYSAIIYKTDRFHAIETGWFWLSETPEIAGSKGWDSACERIATWAVLTDKKSGKSFFVINTHLDHIGKEARREGVALLLQRTQILSNKLPVIITGDFNATPESEVISHVLNTKIPATLYHTKDIAENTSGSGWTFHGFGNVPEDRRQFIDYIFVSEDIKVISHEVLPEKMNEQYISDHSVVQAKIRL